MRFAAGVAGVPVAEMMHEANERDVLSNYDEVDAVALLTGLDGTASVPQAVADEIGSGPAASELEEALNDWITSATVTDCELRDAAADHLGRSSDPEAGAVTDYCSQPHCPARTRSSSPTTGRSG